MTADTLWREPDRAQGVRRDAVILARFAVTSPDLRQVTKTELLSKYVLVLLTHGVSQDKYDTRFRSAGALGSSDRANLEHEHVYPRKWLIERMFAEPDRIEAILTDFAIACTVTIDEHKALGRVGRADPTLTGWSRYRAAGVVVTDLATGLRVSQTENDQVASG